MLIRALDSTDSQRVQGQTQIKQGRRKASVSWVPCLDHDNHQGGIQDQFWAVSEDCWQTDTGVDPASNLVGNAATGPRIKANDKWSSPCNSIHCPSYHCVHQNFNSIACLHVMVLSDEQGQIYCPTFDKTQKNLHQIESPPNRVSTKSLIRYI
jgi:hypothetical protein